MVKGMLSLLTVCPHEVAHLRKELLIAARHILATELRIKFVPHMEKLFDENILLASPKKCVFFAPKFLISSALGCSR
jgi:transformation/transcription domain-associated protein